MDDECQMYGCDYCDRFVQTDALLISMDHLARFHKKKNPKRSSPNAVCSMKSPECGPFRFGLRTESSAFYYCKTTWTVCNFCVGTIGRSVPTVFFLA